MRPTEVALFLPIAAILIGGMFAEGFAAHDAARQLYYAACALAGALSLTIAWRRPSTLGLWLALFIAIPLVAGALLALTLPASFVASVSPAWAEWLDARQAAGLSSPARLSLGLDPEWSARAFNQWMAAGAFFLACLIVARRRLGEKALLALVVMIGLMEGWLSFAALLRGAERATGTLFNPNHSAALILMILPVVGATIHQRMAWSGERQNQSEAKDWWLFIAGGAGVAALGWLATLSRGSLLSAAIVVFLWLAWELWLTASQSAGSLGRRIFGVGVIVLLIAALGVGFARMPSAFGKRLDVEGAGYGRVDMWKATWRGFAHSRFIGLGLGGGAVTLERHLQNSATRKMPGWTHNDHLQLAAETGALGILMAFFWSLGLFRILRRLPIASGEWWRSSRNLRDRAILAGLATVILHSLVDFPLRIPIIGCCYLTLLAIMASRLTRLQTRRLDMPMKQKKAGGLVS